MLRNFILNKVLCLSLIGLGLPGAINAAWQTPFEFPDTVTKADNYITDMAVDANGHAVVLLGATGLNINNGVEAFNFANGTWTRTLLMAPHQTIGFLSVDMDDSGTAVALIFNYNTNDLSGFIYDNGVWAPSIPAVVDNIPFVGNSAVSLNGPLSAIGAWFNSATVRASILTNGIWGPVQNIGTGTAQNRAISVAYSQNGTGVAIWQTSIAGGVKVSNFIGGVWQPEITLDPTGTLTTSAALIVNRHNVGIDSSGNAFAVWTNSVGNVVVSKFNGVSWSPQTIALTTGNVAPYIAVAPGGTAVVVWEDSAGNGIASAYNGTSWGTPTQFTVDPIGTTGFPSVSVDNTGNALAIWGTNTQVLSALLPLGGTWRAPEVVDTPANTISGVISGLSSDGTGFADWRVNGVERNFVFANYNPSAVILPPPEIFSKTCVDRYPNFSDRINIICWTASPSPSVVAYNIYRNGVLIATIPATDRLSYCDHNRCSRQTDVYTVTAVGSDGNESLPITITVN